MRAKLGPGRATALFLVLNLLFVSASVVAQTASTEMSLIAWLTRVHQAARQSVYTGTFVVTSGGGMASAKIWHFCDGSQQLERVESLSGTPRVIFRRNDEVITFFPQSRIAIAEVRESLGLFPNLLKSSDSSIGDFYRLKPIGKERIAGFEAEVFQLLPNDRLRYGYRVWSEQRTGLIMQLQTLDVDSKVLEQAAFSELQLNAPVSVGKLSKMGNTDGYRIVRPGMQKTTPDAQGWMMHKEVDGFRPTGCYQRPVAGLDAAGKSQNTMQWVFSDGLATVSVFVEPIDSRRHRQEGVTDMGGATQTQTRRIGDWWATAVGEVPSHTLNAFLQALERNK